MRYRALAAAFLLIGLTGIATAQYPARAIRIVSPFSAGGASDTITRVVAQVISQNTGQAVIVENKAGAGGRIGYDSVAKAAPDGYVFAVTDSTFTMMPSLYSTLPWGDNDALVPAATMAQTPFVVMVNPRFKLDTLQALVAFAKENPGKLNFGSAGIGSINHIVTELFQREAGIKLTHIPYGGMGEAVNGMLTGSVDLLIHTVAGGAPQINSGQAIGLAVTDRRRSAVLPNIPSAPEAGIPGLIAGNLFGLTAPKGTPSEAIVWMDREVRKALQTDVVKARLSALGATALELSPAEYGALIHDETTRWGSIIGAANIHVE